MDCRSIGKKIVAFEQEKLERIKRRFTAGTGSAILIVRGLARIGAPAFVLNPVGASPFHFRKHIGKSGKNTRPDHGGEAITAQGIKPDTGYAIFVENVSANIEFLKQR